MTDQFIAEKNPGNDKNKDVPDFGALNEQNHNDLLGSPFTEKSAAQLAKRPEMKDKSISDFLLTGAVTGALVESGSLMSAKSILQNIQGHPCDPWLSASKAAPALEARGQLLVRLDELTQATATWEANEAQFRSAAAKFDRLARAYPNPVAEVEGVAPALVKDRHLYLHGSEPARLATLEIIIRDRIIRDR